MDKTNTGESNIGVFNYRSNFITIDDSFSFDDSLKQIIESTLKNNNAVGVLIGKYDEKLSILYASNFFVDELGYDLNDFNSNNNLSLLDIVHERDSFMFDEDNNFINHDGKYDFRMLSIDSSPFFVHAYKLTYKDNNDDLLWVMSIRASEDVKRVQVLNKMFDTGMWGITFDNNNEIKHVRWSDKFRHMLGYKNRDDFPDHMENLLDLVHPYDIDYLKHMFYSSINDPSHEFEFKAQARIKVKSGEYIWFELNSDLSWRPDGSISEMVGIILNINEAKVAQLESEHYKAFHEAYTHNNLCEYYVNLLNNRFDRLKVDKSLTTVFNNSNTWDELINNFINYYIVEADRKALKLFYNRDYILNEFKNNKTELSQECKIILNNEERIVRNVIMKGNVDSNGNLTNVMVFIRDITDPKRATEQRLEMIESNLNMNQLIQGMVRLVDLFIVVKLDEDKYDVYDIDEENDIEGVYSDFVNNFENKFELLGNNGDPKVLFSKDTLRTLLKKETDIIRFEYAYKDRDKIELVSFIPVRWNNGELSRVLIVGQDVTLERKKELETQIALKDACEVANRANESKTEFLSSMSHDIRTPMNAIIGMTAIAGSHINDKDRVIDCLNKINISSRHLLSLINEVLDMSRIESGKVSIAEEEFNLPDLIDNLVGMVTPDMDKHKHEFNIVLNNIVHENVYGDSLRIQQIFTNIISNAIKYTPDCGKISFTMSEKPTNHPSVGCYEFIIEDNGMGMSEEFVKVIFEPFSRSDDPRTNEIQGTGLGMAIVKNIVNMMNGDIKVESKLHEGSKFTVTIYLKLHDVANQTVDELVDLPVLMVDDDVMCCEGTVDILKQIGMKAEYVTSGNEAIELVNKKHQENNDYFVVIMDFKMPELDGIETTREIRKLLNNNDVPIILLSSFDCSDIEDKAKEAGVNGFINKPLFKSRLTATFKQLLEKDPIKHEINEIDKMAVEDFSNKRILLVEDNELNREIAYEIISTTGCSIETAVNGQDALDKVINNPLNYYDLIFMDIQMPILNGYEASKAIRALNDNKGKYIPIVAMTANAFAEDVIKSKDAGMNEHIAKPINLDKLREVMHKYLS